MQMKTSFTYPTATTPKPNTATPSCSKISCSSPKIPFHDLANGAEITFKIRHTPEFTKGIMKSEGNKIILKSEKLLPALLPGSLA
jgi:hypothetical protein